MTLPRRPLEERDAPPLRLLEDRDLAARVADGDGAALAELYDRWARPCLVVARRVLGDGTMAQDAVQEVFLALWRDPSRYDGSRGAFGSWVLAVAHHRAVDAVRREEVVRRRRAPAELLEGRVDDAPSVEAAVESGERRERLRSALALLPEPQREALALAYWGGHTQREIAALTGTPLGTVKTRMLAGMRSLRTRLDGIDGVDDLPGDEPGRRPGVRP